MILKELNVGRNDFKTAEKSIMDKNYKGATIQAYYAIFHAVRALLFKAGYREESHFALKVAFRMLKDVFNTLERGMNLREMADYKETFSENGA